jgi:hypothetical protein
MGRIYTEATDVPPTVLTTEDIREMKQADNVAFHLLPRHAEQPASLIRCTFEPKGKRTGEQDYTIHAGYRLSYGTTDDREYLGDRPSAFHLEFATSLPESQWQSLVSLMRPGDTLTLEWYAGSHSTKQLEKLGLSSDSLTVAIVRKNGTVARFLLEVHTTDTHSPARMIRRG